MSLQREERKASGRRRERLLGDRFGSSLAARGAVEDGHEIGELTEDDVWLLVDNNNIKEETKRTVRADNEGRRRRWQVVPPVKGTRRVGGLSLAFEDSSDNNNPPSSAAKNVQQFFPLEGPPPTHVTQHSAPVNVPDWSKILPESSSECAEGCMSMEHSDDDGGASGWLPPHEYLARESARRKNPATSVFEGVGRTLKGRDMNRVRNAVWRQTGFFG